MSSISASALLNSYNNNSNVQLNVSTDLELGDSFDISITMSKSFSDIDYSTLLVIDIDKDASTEYTINNNVLSFKGTSLDSGVFLLMFRDSDDNTIADTLWNGGFKPVEISLTSNGETVTGDIEDSSGSGGSGSGGSTQTQIALTAKACLESNKIKIYDITTELSIDTVATVNINMLRTLSNSACSSVKVYSISEEDYIDCNINESIIYFTISWIDDKGYYIEFYDENNNLITQTMWNNDYKPYSMNVYAEDINTIALGIITCDTESSGGSGSESGGSESGGSESGGSESGGSGSGGSESGGSESGGSGTIVYPDLESLQSGIAEEIKCQLKFTLDDDSSFTLNTDDEINTTNYITSVKLDEKLSTESNMPVGVNSGNVLDIVLVSENHALIPDNKNSVYYGHMNSKAIIDITVSEGGNDYKFGRYYVTSWTSERSNSSPNEVQIEAVGLMGYIQNKELPDVIINRSMNVSDFIKDVIDGLNNELSENKQIEYSSSDLDFSHFPTMQFCNLETDEVGDTLNKISQCTLTNIFINRSNRIQTDYVGKLQIKNCKYYLDELTSASCNDNYFVDYDGVDVTYSNGDIQPVSMIGSVNDKEITSDGLVDDDALQIKLPKGLYKINRIECIGEDNSVLVYPSSITYSKGKLNIELYASGKTTVRVEVYGQLVDTTELNYKIKGENVLSVKNTVLKGKSYIKKYAKNLINLIKIKTDTIKIQGYFKPDIYLSDTVYVDAEGAMSVSGYYKVVELEWEFGFYGLCDMTLIKVKETEE